jgi:hypothetical protein
MQLPAELLNIELVPGLPDFSTTDQFHRHLFLSFSEKQRTQQKTGIATSLKPKEQFLHL